MSKRRVLLGTAAAAATLGLLAWWLLAPGPGPARPAVLPGAPRAAPPAAPPPPAAANPAAAPPAGTGPEAVTSPPAGTPPSDLPPAGPGTIEGRTDYADGGGVPAPGILVLLKRGEEGRGLPEAARTTSGADGGFRFDGLAPGTWCFSTQTPGSTTWDHDHGTVTLDGLAPGAATLHVERPVPEGEGLLVRGTVRFEDGSPAPSFSFTLRAAGGVWLVEGVEGRFERRLPAAGEYHLMALLVGGAPHAGPGEGPVRVGADGTLAVVLRERQSSSLRVLDAATGAALPSARAFREEWEEGSHAYDHHPNPATLGGKPLPADAEGVIPLGKGGREEVFFVVADGHAWRKVRAVFDGGPPAPVLLKEGGTLRLEIARWPELQDATVCLEGEDHRDRRLLPPPDAGGAAVHAGIPAGSWTVVVRRGAWWDDGIVYGRAAFTLEAGGEATLVVGTDPGTVGAPAPVTLRISAPSGWSKGPVSVEIEGTQPTNASVEQRGQVTLPADGSAASWTTGPIPPGRYSVTVEPQSYHDIVVPPGGGTFDLALPETVEVRVRVVDRETGKPIPGASVNWNSVVPGRNSYGLDSAEAGEAPGECRFRAPPGRVGIWATGPGYESDTDIEFDVAPPGPVLHEARVGRAGVLVVKFRWEGGAPPFEDFDIHFEMGNTSYGMNVEGGRCTRDELPPGTGTLEVKVPEEEFEKVEDREVEIRAGETAEVEVVLARKAR
ncbi:MAG: carboxypeptidase-like regulatory domain-containing protein [Planctomycetes bacterium]|nr:carboxypeptidase-like regulatory domain-containing protein [Planctomycetota bacterium]